MDVPLVREKTYVAGPGDACLFDLGQETSDTNAGRARVEFYWALFNGKEMPRVFTELRDGRSPLFAKLNTDKVKLSFRELLAVARAQPSACEPKISALLMTILTELFGCRPSPVSFVTSTHRVGSVSQAMRKAIDSIAIFYERPMGIKQLAADAGQSLSHFWRRFHHEVGMSPIAYVNFLSRLPAAGSSPSNRHRRSPRCR